MVKALSHLILPVTLPVPQLSARCQRPCHSPLHAGLQPASPLSGAGCSHHQS